jgi:6-phosphogluconolactonase
VLATPQPLVEASRPTIFVVSPDGRHLYVCNSGTPGGVSAYEIDRDSGALSFLNFVESVGRGPSHISLDHSGRFVLNANYGGGYVEVIAVSADGSLGGKTAVVEHHGKSLNPDRQDKPYAHAFKVDPTNKFALSTDLGIDKVLVYRFDAKNGTIAPNDPAHAAVAPGSGPRHIAWHPNGRFTYVIEELSNEVTVFGWDSDAGVLTDLQTISSLPSGYTGGGTAAEIAVHANGRFLYASNRGHDSIAVFAVDEHSGLLTVLEHTKTRGKTPRYFAFDPTNEWMIVTNQDSNNAVVFRVDPRTGRLSAHGGPVSIVVPAGVAFLR